MHGGCTSVPVLRFENLHWSCSDESLLHKVFWRQTLRARLRRMFITGKQKTSKLALRSRCGYCKPFENFESRLRLSLSATQCNLSIINVIITTSCFSDYDAFKLPMLRSFFSLKKNSFRVPHAWQHHSLQAVTQQGEQVLFVSKQSLSRKFCSSLKANFEMDKNGAVKNFAFWFCGALVSCVTIWSTFCIKH